MATRQHETETSYQDGRDELNLADFPISVLQRQQPLDERGDKLDTAVYEASRYDREARQRTQQRVVLETSSRHGLPTPADENVVLALLYIAKHTHNFAEPVVRFAPRQLFKIMGWAPNSRSYDRLREVLRRLKALVIRCENSWWDIGGRGYEAEVATGIISEYELGRQVSGRKKGGSVPPCWVCWSPRFQQSLSSGNLKKLDLERLFSLRLPTSQRMYRFLDKRFYPPHQPPPVEMDLHD
ncbi:MAG TPA: replication initiator protein A, partial [Gemmataceae bacterium]|nr:replication initiator protein A [Gemmataceae bacterium]